jgi:hypothetical protein
VQRLAGIPALVMGVGYGRLSVSIGVDDQGRSVGNSGQIGSVVFEPGLRARLGVLAAAAIVISSLAVVVRLRRRRRTTTT